MSRIPTAEQIFDAAVDREHPMEVSDLSDGYWLHATATLDTSE